MHEVLFGEGTFDRAQCRRPLGKVTQTPPHMRRGKAVAAGVAYVKKKHRIEGHGAAVAAVAAGTGAVVVR
jgi:hypothetical protein